LDVAQPARAPPNATETLEIALPDDVVDDDVREVAAEVVDAEPVFAETTWTTGRRLERRGRSIMSFVDASIVLRGHARRARGARYRGARGGILVMLYTV
jgi:hypothetical protein